MISLILPSELDELKTRFWANFDQIVEIGNTAVNPANYANCKRFCELIWDRYTILNVYCNESSNVYIQNSSEEMFVVCCFIKNFHFDRAYPYTVESIDRLERIIGD